MPSESKGLSGLRVLSLESRRAAEMAKLIASYGGNPTVAPSMREVPIESNVAAIEFARTLADGGFQVVIFLTGVGIRALARVVETVYPLEQFVAALQRVTVVSRGPKPLAALREMGVSAVLAVPEPNTWRDLLHLLDREKVALQGAQVAVQEYGEPNTEMIEGLVERGSKVTQVPVYKWDLPEDMGPLRDAVHKIVRGEIDLILFTTSVQVLHLLRIAREMGEESGLRHGLATAVIGSIGPVTSDELREQKIRVDFEPEHPKMGFLVNEAAKRMQSRKRGSS